MKRLVLALILFTCNMVAMEEINDGNSALKERDAKEKESYKTVKVSKIELLKSIQSLEERIKKVEKISEQCKQEMAKALKKFREGSDRSEKDTISSPDDQENNTMEIVGGMAAVVAIAGYFLYFK